MLRTIQQRHIDASSVRAVVMDNLVVRRLDFRLADQVLQHVTVLYLAESQHRMESFVLICHSLDDRGDVVKFLLIFRLCPLVLAVRKELIVILSIIVVCVEEILHIVEPEHITLRTAGIR